VRWPSSTKRSNRTRTVRWRTTASREIFFLQRNYQSSANSYRSAINGNGDPRWTEVWSHIQLGKIFDITGQRERAINEYRQAIQTNDDTFAALEEARKYLQKAFERPKNKE